MTKRASRAEPSSIECAVTLRRAPVGIRDDPDWTEAPTGVASVEAEAAVWDFGDDDDDGTEPLRVTAATLQGYLIDLDVEPEIFWGLDHISADLSRVSVVAQELVDGSVEHISHVLVISYVSVEPAYRGQRIAPRLLLATMDTLVSASPSTLVAVDTGDGDERHSPVDDLELARHAAERDWGSLGLRRHESGVHVVHSSMWEVGRHAL